MQDLKNEPRVMLKICLFFKKYEAPMLIKKIECMQIENRQKAAFFGVFRRKIIKRKSS